MRILPNLEVIISQAKIYQLLRSNVLEFSPRDSKKKQVTEYVRTLFYCLNVLLYRNMKRLIKGKANKSYK